MVDYISPLYSLPQEVWDEARCQQAAKHTATDGLGTKYPFKGYIGNNYGETRYNGGCVRDGQWWQGEYRPLPRIASGYEIVYVPSWGWRIVVRPRTDSGSNREEQLELAKGSPQR